MSAAGEAAARLDAILEAARAGRSGPAALCGLPSFCTAHPRAIAAALAVAAERGAPALIEATCNQVNQEGGYTGLTPREYRARVEAQAREAGRPELLLLGGDHLGPNPWRALDAETAMGRAEALVAAYAEAGYLKLHLDASMALGGEGPPEPATVARRAARLAAVAERAAPEPEALRYVIGTEVPPPGGETEEWEIAVSRPEVVLETLALHEEAFRDAGQAAAFDRVRAVVVQPGVDFGVESVRRFQPEEARELTGALDAAPGVVFEAHSTDYQPDAALAALVAGRFAILKVGPELTFALREALVALDAVEAALRPEGERAKAIAAALATMEREPKHWRDYCRGMETERRRRMLYGYSDRIRYYWSEPEVAAAMERLLAGLPEGAIPGPLISQHAPWALAEPSPSGEAVVARRVAAVARRYYDACAASG